MKDSFVGDEGEIALVTTTPELNGLESQLQGVFKYLQDLNTDVIHMNQRARVKSSSKYFLVWEGRLFRRTTQGLRLVAPISARQKILRTFHDDIGHWDVKTTKQFIHERYW